MKRVSIPFVVGTLILLSFAAQPARADWDPTNASKWVQLPDLTPNGIGIKCDQWDGPRMLADDFLCTNNSVISDIHIWGSWKFDNAGTITNIYVGIWSDWAVGPVGHSQPSNELWSTVLKPGQFVIKLVFSGDTGEYWWDPLGPGLMPEADRNVWQINIDIDPSTAFVQTGSALTNKVYWLVVKVWTDESANEFGWKTRNPMLPPGHFNDDAVLSINDGTNWMALSYPPGMGAPYEGQSIDLSFVITEALDFGDAPGAYPTLLAGGIGARHRMLKDAAGNWICLGATIDNEQDGQPTVGADGDDTTGVDDEDGMVAQSDFIIGSNAWIKVIASTNGFLSAWIDYNANGSWLDAGEQVFSKTNVLGGTNILNFSVPATASNGYTYARLRFTTQPGPLNVAGLVSDGEVEDYRIYIKTPPPVLEAKWERPLDTRYGIDVPSWMSGSVGTWIADDFVSDGRPIAGVRWWGSYIGYATNEAGEVAPPAPRPVRFTLRWLRDLPAGVMTNYSLPGKLIDSTNLTLLPYGTLEGDGVVEQYVTTIYHPEENAYEHEFVYDVVFTNTPWNEKEGVVYWLGIQADYLEQPSSNAWGWATTPLEYGWNDDTVRTNSQSPVGFDELRYSQFRPRHPHGSNSLNQAFVLYTDVISRRAKKWLQPPDMTNGENMASFTGGLFSATSRADDFVSDGRRITDIHWWGSYLRYLTNFPGPIKLPPPPLRPAGFYLTWLTDKPAPPYSEPLTVITQVYASIDLCHEVYYGSVTQYWKGSDCYDHEFQYYVDLMNPAIANYGPWCESNGITYWLKIQANFTNLWSEEMHKGWGWKTTPVTNKSLGDSVEWIQPPPPGHWQPAPYPVNHPAYPAYTNCDLAFELTTDEVGTNKWYQPIVFRTITVSGTNFHLIGSMGDAGAGAQVLQRSTNLLLVSNWVDVATNPLPVPYPFTNYWYRPGAAASQEFYRIRQN